MIILVCAVMPEGYDGAWRAGRKWSTEPTSVEVLEQDDDPPAVEYTDVVGGAEKKRTGPDRTRIGRNTYKLLVADARIKVLSDKESAGGFGDATLGKTRSVLAATASENAELKVRIAQLEDDCKALRAQLGDQRATSHAAAQEEQASAEKSDEGKDHVEGSRAHRRK